MSFFLKFSVIALIVVFCIVLIIALCIIRRMNKPIISSPYCEGGLLNGDQTLNSVADSIVLCNSNFGEEHQ